MNEDKKKLTVPDLIQRKKDQQRVVMVAAPDFLMAQWAERAGIDFIGIGDSLGMTLYGHPTTCLLYTSPSPRDRQKSRMPSSA